jgi:hypothetical protein
MDPRTMPFYEKIYFSLFSFFRNLFPTAKSGMMQIEFPFLFCSFDFPPKKMYNSEIFLQNMADIITTTGQMTREEMIANILQTAEKIKATKKRTEEMKKMILEKTKIFEEMDKGLDVAKMELEMDTQFALA